MTIAIFHQKYEKVLKTTQNVPKTVDNHQEQLVLGLGYQFSYFSLKKGLKTKFKSPPFCRVKQLKILDLKLNIIKFTF